jgi:hypothetical protein
MKRTVSAMIAMAVVAALVVWAPSTKHNVTTLPVVYAGGGCSNATLTGNYGFTWSGFGAPAHSTKGNEVPFAGAGLGTFDGAGNFSATATASSDGSIFNFPYTATYAVNSDCTGSMTSTNGNANMSFVIVSGGAEVSFLDVDAGSTWTLDAKKAATGCSNATLAGNYGFVYTGFNSKRNNRASELPFDVVGAAAFDGAGNVSFSYTGSFDGSIFATTAPDVGTYAVNSDCTFTMSDPNVGNTWVGTIVGDGSEWDAAVTSTGYTETTVGKKQ